MNNKELLFNLIKKLESGEAKLQFDGEKVFLNEVVIGELEEYKGCYSPKPFNEN
jgi:hypothetical protein